MGELTRHELRALRLARGWTQNQMATALQVLPTTYRHWESEGHAPPTWVGTYFEMLPDLPPAWGHGYAATPDGFREAVERHGWNYYTAADALTELAGRPISPDSIRRWLKPGKPGPLPEDVTLWLSIGAPVDWWPPLPPQRPATFVSVGYRTVPKPPRATIGPHGEPPDTDWLWVSKVPGEGSGWVPPVDYCNFEQDFGRKRGCGRCLWARQCAELQGA